VNNEGQHHMSFQNPVNSITIPSGAQTGSSRIVIGPDVPDALKTFHPYGVDSMVTSAILFYDQAPNTDTYVFLANVENVGGYQSFWIGSVTNGVVNKTVGSSLYPFGLEIRNTGDDVTAHFHGRFGVDPVFGDSFNDKLVMANVEPTADVAIFTRLKTFQAGSIDQGSAETWHTPTLQNGWSSFGSGYVPARYRLIASPPDSMQIEGLIGGGTATPGTVLFNLPVGYRPAYAQRTLLYAFGGGLNISTETVAAEIATNGDVTLRGSTNATFLELAAMISLT
jgi:hypothetical protein